MPENIIINSQDRWQKFLWWLVVINATNFFSITVYTFISGMRKYISVIVTISEIGVCVLGLDRVFHFFWETSPKTHTDTVSLA